MSYHIEITPLLDHIPPGEATEDEIQEGNKADHLIKICATDGEDRLGLQTKKSVQEIFEERFKELNKSSTESCTIFKVNVGLSESKPDAYKPKLISIGPYHKKNPQLRLMEDFKLRYLQRFLRRKRELNVESCIRKLEKLKDDAIKCYDNKNDLRNYSSSQILEMLLLDGCFVVEYIREACHIVPEGEDNIINAEWMLNLIDRDLLLLENQLPFFVLTTLHDMTKKPADSFIKLVNYTFCASLPKLTPKFLSETNDNVKEVKHLLQVVHMCCCPTTSLKKPMLVFEPEGMLPSMDHNIWHDLVRSATELDEGGIKFSKVGDIYRMLDEQNKGDDTSLFDITFKRKVMQIPCFEVVNTTETTLRNLIAYEQHSSDIHPQYFTDYAVFMDRLINSDKDVSLLRQKGIIRNRIGDDIEVANIFNKLGEGVIPSTGFYYKEVCRQVVEHCDKKWNRRMASLWHNYFNGPWVGLSTAAAVILLTLTLMQTVLTFISTL